MPLSQNVSTRGAAEVKPPASKPPVANKEAKYNLIDLTGDTVRDFVMC